MFLSKFDRFSKNHMLESNFNMKKKLKEQLVAKLNKIRSYEEFFHAKINQKYELSQFKDMNKAKRKFMHCLQMYK